MSSGIDKGTGGTGAVPASMLLLDIVTLPVQAVAIPVMLVASGSDKPQSARKNSGANNAR